MEEVEYRDNEQVLYKASLKLKLSDEEPWDAEFLVTRKYLIIDGEEPIKIPKNKIKDLAVPMSSFQVSPSGQKSPELHAVAATLTYLDNENIKKRIFLEGHPGSLSSLRTSIFMEEGQEWQLIDSLENIGIQAELGTGVTIKLIGHNVDEIRLVRGEEGHIAGLIYVVKIPTMRRGKDLSAETEEDNAVIKWIGGELAYHLNEDVELANLISETGNPAIQVSANKKSQHIEILVHSESFPTKESFTAINTIVNHLRAAEASITSGISYSESRIVRGSIKKRVIKAFSLRGGTYVGLLFIIISVIISTIEGGLPLPVGPFGLVGIIILGIACLNGLWTFLSLSIKRLRGRF